MNKLFRKARQKAELRILQESLQYKTCIACNGSGYYDSTASPKCSSCAGTGKVKNLKIDLPLPENMI